ncbi:MAG: hypothetical protein RJB16_297 [Bacteroidota bacterium]|jgi:hypothetical protein
MMEEIDRLEGAFDRLQDQYAALRKDVEKTIATLQQMIEEEQEEQ